MQISRGYAVPMPTARARISFNTPYAAIQHERVDFQHDVGKAKYLEGPLKQFAPLLEEFLAVRMRASLAKAGALQSAASIARMMERDLENAIGEFAEIVLGQAISEAPLEEGTLRASGEVETGMVRGVG